MTVASALIHSGEQAPEVDALVESASDECISDASALSATDSGSEQDLSNVTLAPSNTPSSSLSDLKSVASAEIPEEKLSASIPSSPVQTQASLVHTQVSASPPQTQATPALNPTAPVFKPRAPAALKRRPAALHLSMPTTPTTDSPVSTPGPLTPSSPSPAPAPIPTHFTRRPPVTPRRSGPILNDVKPRPRVFAPVVRGPDGLVRVLAPGGVPLVVEPAAMAADMFYCA